MLSDFVITMLEFSLRTHPALQPFVPYPAYHQIQPQPQQQQATAQAPLVPTGFIQGEQGTLIPLYQPEALDQYATTGNQQPITPTSTTQSPVAWRQYPQVPYPYIHGQPPAPQGSVNWVSSMPPPVFPPGQHAAVPTFRGSHPGVGQAGRYGQLQTPTRRHRQATYDRNLPTRPPHVRYNVGGIPVQGFSGDQTVPEPVRPGIFPPQPAFNGPAGANWAQWNGGR